MTRSPEPEPARTWDENWILIRKLWPDWSPTDEQVREVWFKSFDKQHGMVGEGRVNQIALQKAIVAVARSRRRREAIFIDISDAYRHECGRVHAEIERHRQSERMAGERYEMEREEARLRDLVAVWTPERLLAARERLSEKIPTFDGKSADPASWSRVYVGLLVAADAELQETDDDASTSP